MSEPKHIRFGGWYDNLFDDLDDTERAQIDMEMSAERYVAAVTRELQVTFPEAKIEAVYEWGGVGALPYHMQMAIDGRTDHPDVAYIQDIGNQVYEDGDRWLVTLLTTEDMARKLGVTPRRVRALADSRGVGRQVGGIWLFRPEEVEALQERHPGRPPEQREIYIVFKSPEGEGYYVAQLDGEVAAFVSGPFRTAMAAKGGQLADLTYTTWPLIHQRMRGEYAAQLGVDERDLPRVCYK